MTRNNVCTRRMTAENSQNLVNLVGCSYVHSILAIKMGSVSKLLNVDPHGRPALKFKELASIYNCEGVNKLNSGTTVKLHATSAGGSSVDSQVKFEEASPEKGACTEKSTESGDIQSSQNICLKKEVDLETIHDGDELSFLTLRELKNRCKRQKVIKSHASLRPDDHPDLCSFVCNDTSDRPVKVEPDLDEPLIVLKQRMSKDSKPERKRKKNAHQYKPDSPSPVQTKNAEEQPFGFGVAEDVLSTDSVVRFHLIEVKEEVLEIDCYDIDTVVPALDNSASNSVSGTDCLVAQSSEEIQSDEPEIGESASMRGNISDCSTDEVFIPDSHKLGKYEMEIYSRMKEMDSSNSGSPEVACTIRAEALQVDSFDEHDLATVSDCSASDCLVAQGSEEIQSDEPEIGESASMRGNISDCSTDEVFIPDSHKLGKNEMEIYSRIKEMDSSNSGSPEVACTIRAEALQVDSFDEHDLATVSDCSASDCLVAQGSEEIQPDELESGESASMRGNISDCSTDEVFIPDSHKLGKNAMEIYSCMKEMDSSNNRSPEVVCTIRAEALQIDSFSERDPVTVSDCSASDLLAEYHPPDKMWDCWNNGCGIGNERRPTFADISQYSSPCESSVPHLSPGYVSLPESSGINSDAGSSQFAPLTGSPDPASATDSIVNSTAIQVTSETSSRSEEHNGGANCYIEEASSEADISFGPCALNTQWEIDDSSVYHVASGTVAEDNGGAGGGICNVHEDNAQAEDDISIGREMPTIVPEIVPTLQPGEGTSGASTPTSCSTSCLDPLDVSPDESDKELTTTEIERLGHRRSDEVNSCSPAAESQNCLSQALDHGSSASSISSVDHSHQDYDTAPNFEHASEASTPVAMVLDVGKVRDLSAEVSSSDEELHRQQEHPPIKLLSNRKVLSPTSQEKLCQAVDAEEPVKPPRSGKRLWFDRKSNGSPPRDPAPGLSGLVPSPERIKMPAPGKRLRFERRSNWATPSEWIHRVPDTTSPERASKRPKNASVGPTKGILKSPPSGAVNSPAQKHAQEAITFSQRQMHDIESLATKLLRGLRSMKGIVEEALTSEESSSAASLKDHTDKMRAAIDDASELEETTKKWLSMMSKDCNRFCKILRSTPQKAPTNEPRKDRKKITFADEAGGMLCHVKLFEDTV